MIKVEHLIYKHILKDLSFTLNQGKIIMILGENGCGKTTLIKNILDIFSPTSGHIYYQDQDMTSFSIKERAKIFSYVPQIKNLVETITIEECVVSGRSRFFSQFETPSTKDYQRVGELLKELGIFHLKDHLLSEVSGGELQLAFVARAIIQDAQIMIMDEPCTYLDFQKQYLFLDKIKNLRKADKTFLITIHDPNLALRYADQIIMMSNGRIYEIFSKEEEDFKERCCQIYNELFGNHFIYNKESDFLYWE